MRFSKDFLSVCVELLVCFPSCFVQEICQREYEERINFVDAGSFTPMIASSTGGMGPEMQMALKHLAYLLLAEKNAMVRDMRML